LNDPFFSVHVDIPEGTGLHAHATSETPVFVNDNRLCLGISLECPIRTDRHTGGFLALNTGKGDDKSVLRVERDPDVGSLTLKISDLIEGASQLTVLTAHAPIEVNGKDLHLRCPLLRPFFW
jgi:hypothetical protein